MKIDPMKRAHFVRHLKSWILAVALDHGFGGIVDESIVNTMIATLKHAMDNQPKKERNPADDF